MFLLFIWIKELCIRKFEGLARSKLLGISQTELFEQEINENGINPTISVSLDLPTQSQKTQARFRVADFATLSDETRSGPFKKFSTV